MISPQEITTGLHVAWKITEGVMDVLAGLAAAKALFDHHNDNRSNPHSHSSSHSLRKAAVRSHPHHKTALHAAVA